MPLNVQQLSAEVDQENEDLERKLRQIDHTPGMTYDEKRDASFLATQIAIHARLGDLVKLQLQGVR